MAPTGAAAEAPGAGAGGVGWSTGVGTALPPRILNMTTPQVGQVPLTAFRPFFMTSSTPFAIGFLALHLTQYPSCIVMPWVDPDLIWRRYLSFLPRSKSTRDPQSHHFHLRE